MKKLTNYSFSADAKRFVHIVIYIIFLVYSVYLIIEAPELSVKIVYAFITAFFLSFACFSEYLEYLSEQAIKALNYECNPEKALQLYDRLQKMDFIKSYKKNRILFDTMYNLAIYNPQETLRIIQTHDTYFRSNLDALFIRNVSTFIAYVELNNKAQARKAYPEIVKLKGSKIKGKKLSPLYSWEELEALHYLMDNDFDKACKCYEKVNMMYMNNKEKTQLYLFYYKSLLQNGDINIASEIKAKLVKVANLMPIDKIL